MDAENLTYEQARDELVAIVAKLEEGTTSLEESLTLWERGEALGKFCNQWLEQAQQRLAAGPADQTADPRPSGQHDPGPFDQG